MPSQTTKRRFWLILILAGAVSLAAAPKNYPVKIDIGPIHWEGKISSPEIDWRIGKFEFRRDLAIKKGFFTNSSGAYHRDTNPNLLPQNTWFGVRSVVKNLSGGRVQIQLYVDRTNTGKWELATEAIDDGSVGGPVIAGEGYGGLRTDYMDVTFDNYYMKAL